ncbi:MULTISPECIES: DUF5685 family protein [Streptomyces]|uniref:DUF5685 family protein n=1 Tax=Streptomyces TaxID=1883 RepID=UPI001D155112|nr:MULTISPECIES: DUF5685 family protein [Streptomyces]MCC3654951.1 DUF5685 family protein [Streptomyces sp. S07_1.15]WSQ70716.1 DUF5685 family protein [Streptomyces xinghaiensis]
MFGIVRPCPHRLSGELRAQWTAHLCGLCLALRDDHGQFARVVTHYDALLVSVLTEAQSERPESGRRTAGPCPLRGLRTASVARGEGARLAAAVSLVLASARMRDHVTDRDGLLARRPAAAVARRLAASWDRAGARTGADLGFATDVLVRAVERQPEVEAAAGPGTPLRTVTEPTETATAAAFGYTAVLAGRKENAGPLAEAGRYFGRLAHLLDAVEDRDADAATGAWNPLTATGTDTAAARRECDEAVRGVRQALRKAEFTDGALAHRLLAHEPARSVDRAFGSTSCTHLPEGGKPYGHPHGNPYAAGPGGGGPGQSGGAHGGYGGQGGASPYAGGGAGGGFGGPGGTGGPGGAGGPGGPGPRYPRKRGLMAGCAVWTGLFCTCQVCCRKSYDDPWRHHKKRDGWCRQCDGDCCDCCECCSCDC